METAGHKVRWKQVKVTVKQLALRYTDGVKVSKILDTVLELFWVYNLYPLTNNFLELTENTYTEFPYSTFHSSNFPLFYLGSQIYSVSTVIFCIRFPED